MKKLTALLLMAALLCGVFSGCGSQEADVYVPTGDALLMEGQDPEDIMVEEEEPQELTLAYNPDRSMNPLIGYSQNNRVLFSLMYQGLFAVDSSNNPTPILCSAYQVSPSNMIYTFYIESNATYSDGTRVTIDDVLASYEAAMESSYYKGRFTYVDSVSLSGDGGIRFSLTTPYENLPVLLDIPIVKASEVDAEYPLGSGPYAFADGIGGAHLRKVTTWWADTEIAATADSISLVEAIDEAQVRDEFEFGDVGLVCTNPLASTYAEYRCDYELWDVDSGVFLYLCCNVTWSDYFEDGTLRKVLTYAIDRETINEKFYRGRGLESTLAASPASPYYSSSLASKYAYDPMKFIDEISDYTLPKPEDKDDGERTMRLLVNCDDSARLRAARSIAETLTELGIPTTTLEYGGSTKPTYEAVLQANTWDVYLGQTRLPANYDLSEFVRPWGNLSWGGLDNENIQSRCKDALANSGNYYNLLEMIAEDGRIIPVLFGTYAVYAERGLFDGLSPSRDNVFYYSLGKTMESAKIATVYD